MEIQCKRIEWFDKTAHFKLAFFPILEAIQGALKIDLFVVLILSKMLQLIYFLTKSFPFKLTNFL